MIRKLHVECGWLLVAVAASVMAQPAAPTVPGLDPLKTATKNGALAPLEGRGAPSPGRGGPAPGRGATSAAEKAAPEKPAVAPKPTGPPGPRDMKFGPLHTVQPPKLVTSALSNGLKLYLTEDHDLPVIAGVVMVRTGDAFDPPERVGLASLAGYLLPRGGTALKTGDQVDETLARLGMSVEANFAETSAIVNFSGLRRNAEPTLALLRELVSQPEFRQDRLEQAKVRARAAIAHRNDDIPAMMRREMSSLIFGKSSPYGWQADYAGLERITRTDLRNFHRRYFFPGNVMLGIRGDFDVAQMQAMVEKAFGSWNATQPAVAEFPKATATAAPGFYLGEKKDTPVSYVMVGQPGGTVTQKDYAALEVMGLIMNQLQARITHRARTQGGATNLNLTGVTVDDVKASWSAGFDRQGIFRIYSTCRGAATVEVIKAIQDELQFLRTQEVAEEELKEAKESALTAMAGAWDTAPKAFLRVMTQEYYGLPRGFAQEHQAAIMAVTRADVLRVAKQYLHPESMTTLVIGNPQMFATPLENLSPQINRLDLTLPEPKQSVTESTDASIAEGKRLLQRAAAAVGGADKLAAVKDYTITAEYQLDPSVPDIGGYKVPQTDRWMFPAIFRQDLSLPTGTIIAYSDGKAGWIAARQGWGALAGIQLKQLQGDLFRSYFRLLISDQVEGRTVNMVDQDLVEITDTNGQLARIEFDPQSGLPARVTYDVPQAGGAPIFSEDVFSDFREVNGIKIPFKTVINQGGKRFADVLVTNVKLNSGLRQVELALRPQ
jgi:zinc protease